MALSQEDSFRLQVLLSQDLQAVKINESNMVLYALTGKGEAKVELHPNCRDELYLRQIREHLSTHVLGSPGGYPVFLKRWTRMGQTRSESLESLLLLGEPEAVVAVAHANEITEEIARRTWWAMPHADVARRMLENRAVAESELGKELAAFLLEFLPFEEDANAVINSVRLVLQPGLIAEQDRLGLWRKAGRKTAMYVGFLFGDAENLPAGDYTNTACEQVLESISAQAACRDYNDIVAKLSENSGQTFLATVDTVMKKMSNQDVALQLFNAIQHYFNPEQRLAQVLPRDINEIPALSGQHLQALKSQASISAQAENYLQAALQLAHVSEQMLNPVFAQTDAIGSVMRKRLQPMTDFIARNIAVLQGKQEKQGKA